MTKVTIYSKNQCIKCNMTKKFLKQHSIDFDEINIDDEESLKKHGKTYDEVVSYIKDTLNLRTMPIVETDSDTWGDYQLNKLRELVTK